MYRIIFDHQLGRGSDMSRTTGANDILDSYQDTCCL